MSRDTREFIAWIIAIDPGYTHPTAMAAIGIDGDGRLHIAEEFYQTGVLHERIVANTWEWYKNYRGAAVVVDQAAAELIAEIKNAGMRVEGHKGKVLDGIAIVQSLLAVQGDGKPRLTVDPACVNAINEMESYVWKEGKDEPVKENDHLMDATRYAAHWLYGEEFVQRQYIYSPERIG
jgi:phage terminase large subunit